MKLLYLRALAIVFLISGCASRDDLKLVGNLQAQLVDATHKFESARKENSDLKEELVLFKKAEGIDSEKFIQAEDALTEALAQEETRKQAWVHISDRGLVIIISAEKLFVSGSDNLTGEGEALLDKIFNIIKGRFLSNYIYVEGHTDNQSLAVFEWKSDWDFSFARALSVVKYFTEREHMDPLRLSASGFGQYRPRQSNETKEGRRLNRRVEIIISSHGARQIKHSF